RKQLSPAVSTSKPLLTEEESLSSDSSSSLLIADEPLSPEVPLPNVDYAPVVQESSSNSVINSAKEIVLSEDQEADKAISKPETGNVLVTSTTELYLDNAGDKNYPKKLAKKKPIKPLKDILKTTEDLSLHGSKFIGTSIIGKKVAFHENLSAEVHDKVNQRLLLPLSRNAKNQRIAVSKGNQVTAAKRRHSGESVSTGAQKMQKICEPNPSVIEPPMVKKRKEVANVQARYEIKNSETAVLSFLDDLLVKKCRLEDILLKFRDLATSQSLSTTELSSCLVKYVNNANIGKVPWSSLIGLIQKGRSLQGNLVELINQLSAESQWTTLGIEFCRKLCLSFLRSNQLLNASRHLNIACCLILISRALSMDSELSEEIDYNEIKTLLLGILKYSICNHPSEWVVPMLCLAQKFVPHLVKDLYCKCGISSDRGFVCELISVHLAAKHDYFSKFMSFWHETETEDPVDVKKIDAAEFNKMLIVRKDDVLSTRNGVNIEKQVVNPHMQFMISSYISLFLIADPLLFPDKIDYTLKLLSQTLSALTNNEETLYAVNVNSAKEKNINSLLLCAYLLRGIRGMYRLNVDSIARLKKLAFDAYELYQDIHTRSQEQVISNEEQCLQFAVEQLFFALQI
uniref:WAPL domain-containing protein n=1 Tax=Syphacia muris TaxID=451379 RepID=A0A0N5AMM2_9BILA